MKEFIQTYLNKLDITTIIENILTKLISLLFLFLLFYIAKKLLHTMVQRIVKPSLKMSRHDIGRQKTISRLLENVFNYTLYFFLLYCILSILGLPVSSLLAGAGIAGVAIGMGAQGFLSDVINGFFILFERQLDVGDEVVLTNGPIPYRARLSVSAFEQRNSEEKIRFCTSFPIGISPSSAISHAQTRPVILSNLWYNRKSLIKEKRWF